MKPISKQSGARPAKLVGVAWAILTAVTVVTLGGFGLLLLTHPEGISLSGGVIALIFLSLLIILTISWLLVRHLAPREPERRSPTQRPILHAVELQAELLRRGLRSLRPRIVETPPGRRRPVDLARAGTVTLLVGHPGSKLLGEIVHAAEAADWATLRRLSNTVRGQYMKYAQESRRIYPSLSAVPAFDEFRYKGRVLCQGIFLADDIEVAAATILYNGGKIDLEAFQVLEYFRPDFKLTHDAVILVNRPQLSKLEQAILERVPDDLTEVNLSAPGSVAYTPVVKAVAAVAGAALVEQVVAKAADWVTEKMAGDDAAADRVADAAERQAAAAEAAAAAAERQADAAEREAEAAEREAEAAEREAEAAEREAEAAEQEAADAEQDQAQQEDHAEEADHAAEGEEHHYVEPREADEAEQADLAEEEANEYEDKQMVDAVEEEQAQQEEADQAEEADQGPEAEAYDDRPYLPVEEHHEEEAYIEPVEAEADDQGADDADEGGTGTRAPDSIRERISGLQWLDPTVSAHALLEIRLALLQRRPGDARDIAARRKV